MRRLHCYKVMLFIAKKINSLYANGLLTWFAFNDYKLIK